jgi:preprotein translocase subunit SecE
MRAETTSEKTPARLNVAQSVTEYVKEVRVEMAKVTWPGRAELRESTLVVIVMVFIIAIFIGVVDRALSLAFEAFIRMIG